MRERAEIEQEINGLCDEVDSAFTPNVDLAMLEAQRLTLELLLDIREGIQDNRCCVIDVETAVENLATSIKQRF